MRRLALVAALALGACDRGVELTNASIEEVAQAAKGIEKPQPGEWETTTELVSLESPGAPAGMADVLRQQVGRKQTDRACLTREQADRPVFGNLSAGGAQGCRFATFAMKAGKLDATMSCSSPDGGRLVVGQAGTYSSTAVDLTATIRRADAETAGASTMTTRLQSRRVGACGKGKV